MTDEEKKAIANLKTEYEKLIKEDNILFPLYKSDAKRLINLIEKQSKEIEELKEKNRQGKMRIVQLENEMTARIEDVNKYFTPNDKIKAKIEDILNSENGEAIEKLIEWQSLLEKEFPVTITKEELEKRWKE